MSPQQWVRIVRAGAIVLIVLVVVAGALTGEFAMLWDASNLAVFALGGAIGFGLGVLTNRRLW